MLDWKKICYNIDREGGSMPKYKIGEIVVACVTGIESYGIFVGLDEYYSGLIHISEISDNFVRNISDYVKIGETIRARVLEVNDEDCHVKLSIKGLDYRFSRKRRTKIQETELGFSTLEEKIGDWIQEKLAEID